MTSVHLGSLNELEVLLLFRTFSNGAGFCRFVLVSFTPSLSHSTLNIIHKQLQSFTIFCPIDRLQCLLNKDRWPIDLIRMFGVKEHTKFLI